MPNGEYINLGDHLEYASLGAGCDCPHGPGQCPWGRRFILVPEPGEEIEKYD